MFTKKIPIIYLTKNKLKVVLVKLGKEPKVLKADETSWNKDSLAELFKQAKKQLKTKSVRILLAEDLSYVLQLNIPFDTKLKNERSLIEEKIKSEIPEILEDDDWDFKETGRKTQSDKQVIAFAPVKSSFTLISQALTDAGLKVEAIEPEVVSKIRHENPLIGLALKTDLKGKDEKVLNLKPKKLIQSPPQSKTDDGSATLPAQAGNEVKDSSELKKETKPPQRKDGPFLEKKPPLVSKTLLIVFLVTFALSALIIGGILVQRNALESRSTPSPTPLLTATPEPTIDPTPSPLPSLSPEPEIVLSEYKVQVLNGTGGKGVAGAVKDILEAEGFENVEADNADELDHTKTTIQLKADTPETVWEAIKKVLDSDYDVVKSNEFLSEESDYDVIITVGVLSTIE